jgi:hypothetical protein
MRAWSGLAVGCTRVLVPHPEVLPDGVEMLLIVDAAFAESDDTPI